MRRWAWPSMGSYASLAVAGDVGDGVREAERVQPGTARPGVVGAMVATGRDGLETDTTTNPPHPDLPGPIARTRAGLEGVEAALSPFIPTSDLCRWRSGALDLAQASPLLGEVIRDVEQVTRTTRGGFSPTDRQGHFDPSGYVKGWAVRRAVEGLQRDGLAHVCLGVGGDVQMIGSAGQGQPWRTAVVHPADGRRILAIIEQPAGGLPLAVATSGSAERGEHIWPGPSQPQPRRRSGRLASVTVVGPDLGYVDAYATAIWALARDRPLSQAWAWLPETGCAALAVTGDGSLRATPGMNSHLVTAAA